MWSQILLLISSPIAMVIYHSRMGSDRQDAKYLGLLIYISIFLYEISLHFDLPFTDITREYIAIFIFVLILILLLMSIRRLRPDISRYPYPFVYVPLIILFFYPLIAGVSALTDIVLIIIQGGSLLSIAFLTTAHFDLFHSKWVAIMNILLLGLSYSIYWFMPSTDLELWMWQSFIAAGMVTTAISLPVILSETNLYKKPNNI